MHIRTLGAWAGFALQICAGAATVIWPGGTVVAWGIFAVGSALLIGSVLWWFFANYSLRWPFARRGKRASFAPWPKPYSPEHIANQKFYNDRVILDGRKYFRCRFENCTYVYNGTTAIQLEDCDFAGSIQFSSDNPAVMGAFVLWYAFKDTPGGMGEIRGLDESRNTIKPVQSRKNG